MSERETTKAIVAMLRERADEVQSKHEPASAVNELRDRAAEIERRYLSGKEPPRCVKCGDPVGPLRASYAIPHCYACLAPPDPLPVVPLRAPVPASDVPARIGEIRKRIAEATPGPWAADRIGTESSRVGRAGMVARQVYCAHHGDAALIASAPADLAWLCDEVERLAGERDTARDHAIDAVREEMDEEVRAMLDGATGDRDFFKQPPPGTSPWQTQLFLRAAEWSDSLRSEVERLTAELAKRDEED